MHMSLPWTIHQVAEASSTNDLAFHFPAWTIVRCDEQKRGRGRFNRAWIGHAGGLWATYNVPLDSAAAADWSTLPLVAGLALVRSLEALGLEQARLRWPNDLLIGSKKLAGILVERPAGDMACIGVGVNMHNSLAAMQGRTTDPPVRLADLIHPCPSVKEYMLQLAHELVLVHTQFTHGGLRALLPQLARVWKVRLPVSIETDAATYQGIFQGITENGSPIVQLANGTRRSIPAHLVNRLSETTRTPGGE